MQHACKDINVEHTTGHFIAAILHSGAKAGAVTSAGHAPKSHAHVDDTVPVERATAGHCGRPLEGRQNAPAATATPVTHQGVAVRMNSRALASTSGTEASGEALRCAGPAALTQARQRPQRAAKTLAERRTASLQAPAGPHAAYPPPCADNGQQQRTTVPTALSGQTSAAAGKVRGPKPTQHDATASVAAEAGDAWRQQQPPVPKAVMLGEDVQPCMSLGAQVQRLLHHPPEGSQGQQQSTEGDPEDMDVILRFFCQKGVIILSNVFSARLGQMLATQVDTLLKGRIHTWHEPLVKLAAPVTAQKLKAIMANIETQLRRLVAQNTGRDPSTLSHEDMLRNLPAVWPTSDALERVLIEAGEGLWQDVPEMAGQFGVRVRAGCKVDALTPLGAYAGESFCEADFNAMFDVVNQAFATDTRAPEVAKLAHLAHMLPQQIKLEADRYADEVEWAPEPEKLQELLPAIHDVGDVGGKMITTALRFRNNLAFLNDPGRDMMSKQPKKGVVGGGPNVIMVPVLVLGIIPLAVVVAKRPLKAGDHILYEYGEGYWELHRDNEEKAKLAVDNAKLKADLLRVQAEKRALEQQLAEQQSHSGIRSEGRTDDLKACQCADLQPAVSAATGAPKPTLRDATPAAEHWHEALVHKEQVPSCCRGGRAGHDNASDGDVPQSCEALLPTAAAGPGQAAAQAWRGACAVALACPDEGVTAGDQEACSQPPDPCLPTDARPTGTKLPAQRQPTPGRPAADLCPAFSAPSRLAEDMTTDEQEASSQPPDLCWQAGSLPAGAKVASQRHASGQQQQQHANGGVAIGPLDVLVAPAGSDEDMVEGGQEACSQPPEHCWQASARPACMLQLCCQQQPRRQPTSAAAADSPRAEAPPEAPQQPLQQQVQQQCLPMAKTEQEPVCAAAPDTVGHKREHGPQHARLGGPSLGGAEGFGGADGLGGADGVAGAEGFGGADGLDGANGLGGADGLDGADGVGGANGLGRADGLGGARVTASTSCSGDMGTARDSGAGAGLEIGLPARLPMSRLSCLPRLEQLAAQQRRQGAATSAGPSRSSTSGSYSAGAMVRAPGTIAPHSAATGLLQVPPLVHHAGLGQLPAVVHHASGAAATALAQARTGGADACPGVCVPAPVADRAQAVSTGCPASGVQRTEPAATGSPRVSRGQEQGRAAEALHDSAGSGGDGSDSDAAQRQHHTKRPRLGCAPGAGSQANSRLAGQTTATQGPLFTATADTAAAGSGAGSDHQDDDFVEAGGKRKRARTTSVPRQRRRRQATTTASRRGQASQGHAAHQVQHGSAQAPAGSRCNGAGIKCEEGNAIKCEEGAGGVDSQAQPALQRSRRAAAAAAAAAIQRLAQEEDAWDRGCGAEPPAKMSDAPRAAPGSETAAPHTGPVLQHGATPAPSLQGAQGAPASHMPNGDAVPVGAASPQSMPQRSLPPGLGLQRTPAAGGSGGARMRSPHARSRAPQCQQGNLITMYFQPASPPAGVAAAAGPTDSVAAPLLAALAGPA